MASAMDIPSHPRLSFNEVVEPQMLNVWWMATTLHRPQAKHSHLHVKRRTSISTREREGRNSNSW